MKSINCHSSTKKIELVNFVEENKGQKIEVNYENNFIDSWGDDDVFTFDTSEKTHYKEILKTIEEHYIHYMKCVK